MSLAVKVWCPADERMPSGLFNKESCPKVFPDYFREEPAEAARRYALERSTRGEHCPLFGRSCGSDQRQCHAEHLVPSERIVHVLDDKGDIHQFKTRTALVMTAHVIDFKEVWCDICRAEKPDQMDIHGRNVCHKCMAALQERQ